MKFSLTTIAYAFALLAAGMATFGGIGLLAGGVVALFWATMFKNPRVAFVRWVIAAFVIVLMTLLLLPAMATARNAATRNGCLLNLKALYLAMDGYHAKHGSYPPAYVADASGKPMHSWRVLLLPFLQEQDLYDAYDFSEAWHGPNNRKLWDRMPAVYQCASREWCRRLRCRPYGESPKNSANYVAVVGESTAWPGDRGVRRSEIKDDPSDTILFLEYSGGTQPWTAPVDLTLNEALNLFETNDAQGHISVDERPFTVKFERSLHLLACEDGHVKASVPGAKRALARAMLTIAGGEELSQWEDSVTGDLSPRVITVVRYEPIYAALTFAVLAVFPGFILTRKRRRANGEAMASTNAPPLS